MRSTVYQRLVVVVSVFMLLGLAAPWIAVQAEDATPAVPLEEPTATATVPAPTEAPAAPTEPAVDPTQPSEATVEPTIEPTFAPNPTEGVEPTVVTTAAPESTQAAIESRSSSITTVDETAPLMTQAVVWTVSDDRYGCGAGWFDVGSAVSGGSAPYRYSASADLDPDVAWAMPSDVPQGEVLEATGSAMYTLCLWVNGSRELAFTIPVADQSGATASIPVTVHVLAAAEDDRYIGMNVSAAAGQRDYATLTVASGNESLVTIAPMFLPTASFDVRVPVRDSYTITVTSTRYEPFAQTYTFDPANAYWHVDINLKLKPSELGTIEIGSVTGVPAGINYWLSSIEIAQADETQGGYGEFHWLDETTTSFPGIPAGTYVVRIEGWPLVPWEATIEVRGGQTTVLEPVMTISLSGGGRGFVMGESISGASVEFTNLCQDVWGEAEPAYSCTDVESTVVDDAGHGVVEALGNHSFRWTPTYGYEIRDYATQFIVRFTYLPDPSVTSDLKVNIRVQDNADDLVVAAVPTVIVDGSQGTVSLDLDDIVPVSGGMPPYYFYGPESFPQHGSHSVEGGNVIKYTPSPGYEGVDSFSVYVVDSGFPITWEPRQVTGITIPLMVINNAAPLTASIDGPVILYHGQQGSGYVSSGGGTWPVEFTVDEPPDQGAVRFDDAGYGWFTYTPNEGASGWDSFIVQVTDSGFVPAGDSTNPYEPRTAEVEVRVLIRPAVTIDAFTCDGALTYTVADGDWGGDQVAEGYRDLYFGVTSPGIGGRQVEEANAVAPDRGPGTFSVKTDLRPGDYPELTAHSPSGDTLTITDCYPGGDPELEPWATLVVDGVTCDGTVGYTLSEGYVSGPPWDWNIWLFGERLDGGTIVGQDYLGGSTSDTTPGTFRVDTGADLTSATYDRIRVFIGWPEYGGRPTASAEFDSCIDTLDPATEQPLELTYTVCATEACGPPYSTGADGFTASWTITEQDQATSTRGINALRAAPGDTWVVSAVIRNGVATGLSEPLPTGSQYRVCLNPTLTRPDGAIIQIASAAACNDVSNDPGGGDEQNRAFETYFQGPIEIVPARKDDCKNGGYQELGYPNQGQCIKAVNHRNE